MRGRAFALGTFEAPGGEVFAGLVLGTAVHELRRHLGEGASVRDLVESWDSRLDDLQALADRLAGSSRDHELEELRPLPPVLPCGQIFQAGANYRQHLVELTAERGEAHIDEIDTRARSGSPYVFLGLPHAVVGANDDVVLPPDVEQVDWELELAAVIGRRAWRVHRDDALAHVTGYTICNDITARDRVGRPDLPGIGTDWLASKNRPSFFPTGPLLVPARHAGDPMRLQIRLWLNGEVMQDSSTADMMFDLAGLIEHSSSLAELRPGDLLLTGSPAGNGVFHGRFLQPVDVMEAEITGLGRQRNRCVGECEPGAAMAATGEVGREGGGQPDVQ